MAHHARTRAPLHVPARCSPEWASRGATSTRFRARQAGDAIAALAAGERVAPGRAARREAVRPEGGQVEAGVAPGDEIADDLADDRGPGEAAAVEPNREGEVLERFRAADQG